MAKLLHKNSRRMYSWWWDSHISPKNSKWLQENLTDMDSKVKAMIKLIEEDADSFARRAEMYYKKRPELMKLVEEFYRAYRALAERYDNATGVLRQAHKRMSESFPNQMPMLLGDDSPADLLSETDFQNPEKHNDGKRNGRHDEESDSLTNRFDSLKVKRGLNFSEVDDSNSEGISRLEKEIQTLKEALAKLEAEKVTGQAEYQKSQKQLSTMHEELSKAKLSSNGLIEKADKAEGQIQSLREVIDKLNEAKEASLLQYEQCLEKISNLERDLSDSKGKTNEATRAETDVQTLKQELTSVESEKTDALGQYMEALEKIKALEAKLLVALEDSRRFMEQAEKAEMEVESLNQALHKMKEEKDVAAHSYQQCLEAMPSLEEEINKLTSEIENNVEKLKEAEEKRLLLEQSNQYFHSELKSAAMEMGSLRHKLMEKQEELGRLWASLQEERIRFVEAETTFQTLQHLHSKTQEEMRYVLKLLEENKRLDELNLSSTMSTKDMQSEVLGLRELKEKLEGEVEVRVEERNALQQEIYGQKSQVLLIERHKLVEASISSEKQAETESFSEQLKIFRTGLCQLLKVLEIDAGNETVPNVGRDQTCLNQVLSKLEDVKLDLHLNQDDNRRLTVEISVFLALLTQLSLELKILEKEKQCVDKELSVLQIENRELMLLNQKDEDTDNHEEKEMESQTKVVAVPELLDLQTRLKVIEQAVVQMGNASTHINLETEDKLAAADSEISHRFSSSPREMGRRKIAERLDSDIQKLRNLQITVDDMKTKMMATKKRTKRKSLIDWDTLQEQVEESEATLHQLLDQHERMVKNINENFDENREIGRSRIIDQARKLSEKIGRLQLEVQKIQFVLLKVDDRKEKQWKVNRIVEFKRRVLLKDYLYGNGQSSSNERKTKLCGCVQTPRTGK